MRFNKNAVFAALAVLAATSEAAALHSRGNTTDACTQIYRTVNKAGKNQTSITIPGELGLNCMKDMPFDSQKAVNFTKELGKWFEWQSDIELLKNPPSGYQMPATDIMGGLAKIQDTAAKNGYDSHYDFDSAITDLIYSAFDGHLSWILCSSNEFSFKYNMPIVSISSNGTTLPEVYALEDAKLAGANSTKVSPIVEISGHDVQDYLKTVSKRALSQDWDALYNQLFYSIPVTLSYSGSGDTITGNFDKSTFWPGASQDLKFKNCTQKTIHATAEVDTTWSYKNATMLWEQQCVTSPSSSSFSKRSVNPINPIHRFIKPPPAERSLSSSSGPNGYPTPFDKTTDNFLMTFFPKGKDYGVLAIPSFLVSTFTQLDFDEKVSSFLKNATEKGKKRIIVDLQGNGGGTIAAGHNMFRAFFPQEEVYSANRFRLSKGIELVGKALSSPILPFMNFYTASQPYNWKQNVRPNQEEAFDSFEEFFGPYDVLSVPSSALYADNLTLLSTPGVEPISGYGEMPLDPKRQLFDAENIILLSDGYCASTCTLFTSLMKSQGVRTIAFGGRPLERPMQGMGGVKGSQVLDSTIAAVTLKKARELAFNGSAPLITDQDKEDWDKYVPIDTNDMSFQVSSAAVNIQSAFGPDNDTVPKQFVYEAAECRRFYTYKNIVDQESTWASAADAMFYGGPCVSGSMNGAGSLDEK